MQLTIGTLVMLVLAMLVLIALILAFTMGWERFLGTIRGYFGSEIDNLNKLCQNQCNLNQEHSFCCEDKELEGEMITCLDERLNFECNMDCTGICEE